MWQSFNSHHWAVSRKQFFENHLPSAVECISSTPVEISLWVRPRPCPSSHRIGCFLCNNSHCRWFPLPVPLAALLRFYFIASSKSLSWSEIWDALKGWKGSDSKCPIFAEKGTHPYVRYLWKEPLESEPYHPFSQNQWCIWHDIFLKLAWQWFGI